MSVQSNVAVTGDPKTIATFTFNPSQPGRLRCGCMGQGLLVYQEICECLQCGATWILLAERFGMIRLTDESGSRNLMFIVPGTEPAQDSEETEVTSG